MFMWVSTKEDWNGVRQLNVDRMVMVEGCKESTVPSKSTGSWILVVEKSRMRTCNAFIFRVDFNKLIALC